MRLLKLDSNGNPHLTAHFINHIPPYAILSHTWGRDDEEVTFNDLQNGSGQNKVGYAKIQFCGEQAKKDGLQYFWVDTCCIDKSSSAELSEAINSMFRWYRLSTVCYAYLSDVSIDISDIEASRDLRFSLGGRKWFQRGWTLQELIAPSVVEFYDDKWREIGTKLSLSKTLSEITGIDTDILVVTTHLSEVNVATRMSWAAERVTTREEDEAYSLIGIFEVNMTLLYGEGRRAFRRLQEEILRTTEDYTIFAWVEPRATSPGHANHSGESGTARGLLAASPKKFVQSQRRRNKIWGYPSRPYSQLYKSISEAIEVIPSIGTSIRKYGDGDPPTLTCRGLSLNLPIRRKTEREHQLCLTCTRSTTEIQFLCLTAQLAEPKNESSLAIGSRTPVYTTANTGALEFLSQTELGDCLFDYAKIFLSPTYLPTAIVPQYHIAVRPYTSLTVLTVASCSISDSHFFWNGGTLRDSPANEFQLGQILDEPSIAAVFAVDVVISPEKVTKIVVAFGVLRPQVSWCDIVVKPQEPNKRAHDSKVDVQGASDSDGQSPCKASSIDDILDSDEEQDEQIFDQKLFESPLSAAFEDTMPSIRELKSSGVVPSSIRAFRNRSDRQTGEAAWWDQNYSSIKTNSRSVQVHTED